MLCDSRLRTLGSFSQKDAPKVGAHDKSNMINAPYLCLTKYSLMIIREVVTAILTISREIGSGGRRDRATTFHGF